MSQIEPLYLDASDEGWESDDESYLSKQLVTYIGNKRGLARQLSVAFNDVRERVGGRKLSSLDLFSGTGFVARLLKQHSTVVYANDLEGYSKVINDCFLSNRSEVRWDELTSLIDALNTQADRGARVEGFFQELYAPADDHNIQAGERVFYTADNARRLDLFGTLLREIPEPHRTMILGPLLSRASMHANTSGVFKGFYKDKNTGVGKFGGAAADALKRILEPIRLEVPVLSQFDVQREVTRTDANELVRSLPAVDVAYIDPPYNQHPYGSNYFMLNLLCDYERPSDVSDVSGIPTDWNRSGYNIRKQSLSLMTDLIENLNARFVLISFNDEGYIAPADMRAMLTSHGTLEEVIVPYNTFRGSRNLNDRAIHVNEHLFMLERN